MSLTIQDIQCGVAAAYFKDDITHFTQHRCRYPRVHPAVIVDEKNNGTLGLGLVWSIGM